MLKYYNFFFNKCFSLDFFNDYNIVGFNNAKNSTYVLKFNSTSLHINVQEFGHKCYKIINIMWFF